MAEIAQFWPRSPASPASVWYRKDHQLRGEWRERSDQVRPRRNADSEILVQPRGRSAAAAAAGFASRHQTADRTCRSRAAVSDGADPAGSIARTLYRYSGADPRRVSHVAAVAALSRAAAGAGARHAGQDLLQERRCFAGRFAQAQHSRAAGLVQQRAGHQEAFDRDRCRPVGFLARFRRCAVRHRCHGVSGPRLL